MYTLIDLSGIKEQLFQKEGKIFTPVLGMNFGFVKVNSGATKK